MIEDTKSLSLADLKKLFTIIFEDGTLYYPCKFDGNADQLRTVLEERGYQPSAIIRYNGNPFYIREGKRIDKLM